MSKTKSNEVKYARCQGINVTIRDLIAYDLPNAENREERLDGDTYKAKCKTVKHFPVAVPVLFSGIQVRVHPSAFSKKKLEREDCISIMDGGQRNYILREHLSYIQQNHPELLDQEIPIILVEKIPNMSVPHMCALLNTSRKFSNTQANKEEVDTYINSYLRRCGMEEIPAREEKCRPRINRMKRFRHVLALLTGAPCSSKDIEKYSFPFFAKDVLAGFNISRLKEIFLLADKLASMSTHSAELQIYAYFLYRTFYSKDGLVYKGKAVTADDCLNHSLFKEYYERINREKDEKYNGKWGTAAECIVNVAAMMPTKKRNGGNK